MSVKTSSEITFTLVVYKNADKTRLHVSFRPKKIVQRFHPAYDVIFLLAPACIMLGFLCVIVYVHTIANLDTRLGSVHIFERLSSLFSVYARAYVCACVPM